MKLTGTIRRSDLEGGHWILETTGGERYQLDGTTGHHLADGMRAEVSGSVDKGAMGIGMTAPHFAVSKVRALD